MSRPRVDRPVIDRSRVNAQRNEPLRVAPPGRTQQRWPPVAGVPIIRAPAAPARHFSPPAGRVERPVGAVPGRGEERPAIGVGRSVERGGHRPHVGAARGQGHPHGGAGQRSRGQR
jgi:hypothetical protein